MPSSSVPSHLQTSARITSEKSTDFEIQRLGRDRKECKTLTPVSQRRDLFLPQNEMAYRPQQSLFSWRMLPT